MPSSQNSLLLTAVRILFVVVGVGVTALTVVKLASMPPPPPDSDGFAHGMAAIIGGILIILALGLAAVGVSLPTLLGRDDRLGFNRWQRLALKGAGVLIGGGIVVGLAVGFVTGLGSGIALWLGLVVLAIVIVIATLGWRLAEALAHVVVQSASDGTS